MSVIAGQEAFHSDHGESIEVCRQDVVDFCLELRRAGTRSAPAKIGPNAAQRRGQPISDGIRSVIKQEWPDGIPKDLLAKDRDEKIIERLKEKNKKTSGNISRTIQRVLKAERAANREAPPD